MYEIVKNYTKFTEIYHIRYDMLDFVNSLTLIVNNLKKKYERIIIINTSLKVIVLLAQKSLIHWIR